MAEDTTKIRGKATDNTAYNETIAEPTEDFDLDDFALDSSMLDDSAEEARLQTIRIAHKLASHFE